LNAGDCTGAAAEFLRWNKSKGRVLRGLVKRRATEKAMFEGTVQFRFRRDYRVHPTEKAMFEGTVQ
jgi:hypothetical protein